MAGYSVRRPCASFQARHIYSKNRARWRPSQEWLQNGLRIIFSQWAKRGEPPKSEGRNRNPKPEIPQSGTNIEVRKMCGSGLVRASSRLAGFRISDFGLRPSDFEKIGFSIRFRNFETVALVNFTAGRKSWI